MKTSFVIILLKWILLLSISMVFGSGCGSGGGPSSTAAGSDATEGDSDTQLPLQQTQDIPWLKEGNFWKVSWHEVEIDIGWTSSSGDYDLGTYTIKLGPKQLVNNMEMYELLLTGDTQKYTPLWKYIGTDTYGNIYGLSALQETPVLVHSIGSDEWSGSGFYTEFSVSDNVNVNQNSYMIASQYTSQSGYDGSLVGVGWSANDVNYSGSGCEYFSGYGTVCGNSGTGAGPDVDNSMHYEYWSPSDGPVGMHKAYNYENCLGFTCNEQHVEQRVEVWFYGDSSSTLDFVYEDEPDTYVQATNIDLAQIDEVFTVYGSVSHQDFPGGVVPGYGVTSDISPELADYVMQTAATIHDWYAFEITDEFLLGNNRAEFYLLWNETDVELKFYLFAATDNTDFGFMYLPGELISITGDSTLLGSFNNIWGIPNPVVAGKYLLGVERVGVYDFVTDYGIIILKGEKNTL